MSFGTVMESAETELGTPQTPCVRLLPTEYESGLLGPDFYYISSRTL
jgi:hypothetical protein